jgi:hypothetical protein
MLETEPMDDAYRQLAQELAVDDIRCQFQSCGQMVVSRQVGPIWPDRGNSFWLTHAGGGWHLFTWVPRGYRVPPDISIADLCRTSMAHGDSAMGKVSSHIIQAFALSELTDDEEEAVYRAMESEG